MHFGDLVIRPGPANEMFRRMILLDVDTTIMRTRAQFALKYRPDQENRSMPYMSELMQYIPSPGGVLGYGRFFGALGLGTKIVSGPPTYSCHRLSYGAGYESNTPRCDKGYDLTLDYPQWPVVALFPVR